MTAYLKNYATHETLRPATEREISVAAKAFGGLILPENNLGLCYVVRAPSKAGDR